MELAYRYERQWEFKLIGAKYMADEGLADSPTSQQDLSTWSLSVAYNLSSTKGGKGLFEVSHNIVNVFNTHRKS